MRFSGPKSLLTLTLAAWLCPLASFGEKHQPPPPRPAPPPRAAHPNGAVARPNAPNHPNVAMPDAVARWKAMKPDEREKALAKLPPEQQQRLRDRIAAFDRLPPAEQQRLMQRYENFTKLPPGERQAIRKDFQQLQSLPPDRKQAVNQELARLSKMSDEQRSEYFASEQFRKKFAPAEQEMVQNLSKITPNQQ